MDFFQIKLEQQPSAYSREVEMKPEPTPPDSIPIPTPPPSIPTSFSSFLAQLATKTDAQTGSSPENPAPNSSTSPSADLGLANCLENFSTPVLENFAAPLSPPSGSQIPDSSPNSDQQTSTTSKHPPPLTRRPVPSQDSAIADCLNKFSAACPDSLHADSADKQRLKPLFQKTSLKISPALSSPVEKNIKISALEDWHDHKSPTNQQNLGSQTVAYDQSSSSSPSLKREWTCIDECIELCIYNSQFNKAYGVDLIWNPFYWVERESLHPDYHLNKLRNKVMGRESTPEEDPDGEQCSCSDDQPELTREQRIDNIINSTAELTREQRMDLVINATAAGRARSPSDSTSTTSPVDRQPTDQDSMQFEVVSEYSAEDAKTVQRLDDRLEGPIFDCDQQRSEQKAQVKCEQLTEVQRAIPTEVHQALAPPEDELALAPPEEMQLAPVFPILSPEVQRVETKEEPQASSSEGQLAQPTVVQIDNSTIADESEPIFANVECLPPSVSRSAVSGVSLSFNNCIIQKEGTSKYRKIAPQPIIMEERPKHQNYIVDFYTGSSDFLSISGRMFTTEQVVDLNEATEEFIFDQLKGTDVGNPTKHDYTAELTPRDLVNMLTLEEFNEILLNKIDKQRFFHKKSHKLNLDLLTKMMFQVRKEVIKCVLRCINKIIAAGNLTPHLERKLLCCDLNKISVHDLLPRPTVKESVRGFEPYFVCRCKMKFSLYNSYIRHVRHECDCRIREKRPCKQTGNANSNARTQTAQPPPVHNTNLVKTVVTKRNNNEMENNLSGSSDTLSIPEITILDDESNSMVSGSAENSGEKTQILVLGTVGCVSNAERPAKRKKTAPVRSGVDL